MKGVVTFYTVFSLSSLLICSIVSAQNTTCADRRKTTIVFGNGMFNEKREAIRSLEALEKSLFQYTSESEQDVFAFELAYNESESFLTQLFEVISQRVGSDKARFWRILSGIEIMPDWFQEAMIDISTTVELSAFVIDQDLAHHIERYQELIRMGSKVVLVAHSQGNLYANAAWLSLFEGPERIEPAAFGVVGVATPADHTASATSPYTTFIEDKIIKAVRVVFPSTLEGNMSTGDQEVDGLAHGFVTAYLAVPTSREKILSDVLAVQKELPQPAEPEDDSPTGVLSKACYDAPTDNTVDGSEQCTNETFADTCIEGFFGECWDPLGDFTASLEISVPSALVWPNGAHVEIDTDLSNLDAVTSHITVIGSSGRECGNGETIVPGETGCISSTELVSDKGELYYCIDESGNMLVTCPDNTSFALPADANCVFER
jgi:hypothetical protein